MDATGTRDPVFRTLSGSLGMAVFGSLLTAATGHIAHAEGSTTTGAANAGHRHTVATGSSHIFLTMAAVCADGFLIVLAIKEVSLRGNPPAPAKDDARPAPADT